MSDAWENLLVYSTAPEGSDAWTHLINQEGGGDGGDVVTGCIVLAEGMAVWVSEDVVDAHIQEVEDIVAYVDLSPIGVGITDEKILAELQDANV